MSVTAAINLPANATRSAGESFAAAFTICSTINATFLSQSYTAMADLRNLQRQTPKDCERFKM